MLDQKNTGTKGVNSTIIKNCKSHGKNYKINKLVSVFFCIYFEFGQFGFSPFSSELCKLLLYLIHFDANNFLEIIFLKIKIIVNDDFLHQNI